MHASVIAAKKLMPANVRPDLHEVHTEKSAKPLVAASLARTRNGLQLWKPTRVEPPKAFPDIATMVRETKPDHPVFCIRPDELRRLAKAFTTGFNGTPLYAVKCNPDPFVLSTLFEAGITGFDVASLEEVEHVDNLFGEAASLFFNNPAKSREAIRASTQTYGVRYFTVDHPSELAKIVEETRGDATEIGIAVRVATKMASSRYALSAKFGAAPDMAADLLKLVRNAGFRVGLSFHVGSQCLDPSAFGHALLICREVLRQFGSEVDLLNIGGGFPAPYPGDAPERLDSYFTAAELGRRALGLSQGCLVLCEPGRALVSTAASVVMQVLMRKDETLYCNDGIYGNLQELRSAKERRPARLIRRDGSVAAGVTEFRIFGPTCDSDDVLGCSLQLPDNVQEGDWIELGMMGAYSSATRTPFNGFSAHSTIQVPG